MFKTESGFIIKNEDFPRINSICLFYRTGVIGVTEFYKRMKEYGYTKGKAHKICYEIYHGLYTVIKELKWKKYMITMSLITTSTQGSWSERYFEVRLYVPIPEHKWSEIAGNPEAMDTICDHIVYLGDLFMRCIGLYMESKGYDEGMLYNAKKYFGIMELEEFVDIENRENEFFIEIFDGGSASRIPNNANVPIFKQEELTERSGVKRFWNNIKVGRRYWDDLVKTCYRFKEEIALVRYTRDMGKEGEFRW
jgi:hypothetical protein